MVISQPWSFCANEKFSFHVEELMENMSRRLKNVCRVHSLAPGTLKSLSKSLMSLKLMIEIIVNKAG